MKKLYNGNFISKQHDIAVRRDWAHEIYQNANELPHVYYILPSFLKSLKRIGAEIADETTEYYNYVFSDPSNHLDFFHAVKINVYVSRKDFNLVLVFYSGYYGFIIPIHGTERESLFIPFSV
jgi:hypothetical protein